MTGAANGAWGGATVTVTVEGVDVSCDLIEAHVDRSKNRIWDPADAGVARVTLDIGPTGQPVSRGPVGSFVTVRVAYGLTARTVFTGKVQRRRPSVRPDVADRLTLECVDVFEVLARINRRAGVGASTVGDGETVTARLNRWLDVAATGATRDVGTSTYTCPPTLVDGNILRLLQATAQADGGDLFVAGDGTITFLPWAWQVTADSAVAFFSDRRLNEWVPYSSANLSDDLDEVQNKVTGTRRKIDDADTPTPETVLNASSVSTYGERGDALDDLELDSDGQVVTRLNGLVTVAAFPNKRFDSITVQPAFDPARSWPRTIPVTFGALIGANRLWDDGTQTALYGHVIGELWTITPSDITVEYRVSGTGTWDALRPPRLPVALERCDDGSLHVPDGYPCDLTSTIYIKDAGGVILATYPPGSLCHCGVVFVPDGGVELCLDDGVTQVCVDITDPRIDALLWFDVEDDTLTLREKIDGDPVDGLAGFGGTRLDVIPGLYDAIDANPTGGLIGVQHSTHLETTSLAGGWQIDFWLYMTAAEPAATVIDVVDLETVKLRLTPFYDPVFGLYVNSQLGVGVVDTAGTLHLTGPLADVPAGGWHHFIVTWSSVALNITTLRDGVPV